VTSSLLAAAGVTVIGPLVPDFVAAGSVAVMVCVPAVSNVAVTVATPFVNDTAEKLAPARLSESVTESLKLRTTPPVESSAVMVTLVVFPAERLVGELDTSSVLTADETVIGPLVPAVTVPTDVSVAVIVCVPIVLSVAVAVALPPVNEKAENVAPARLSESVTESPKPGMTLL
jgi:hypothetical protein